MTRVSGIVVTYESGSVLQDCLAALIPQVDEVLVVDNASRDGSAEIACAAGATVIRNVRNEGYGRANNKGVRAATDATWCLILNPDVRVRAGCIAALLRAADEYPDAAVLAPVLVRREGRRSFRTISVLTTPPLDDRREAAPDGDCCTPFVAGACFLVHREFFLGLGGFDERIFLFYEDDDLCRRVRDAGRSIVHVHDAEVKHRLGSSTQNTRGITFRTRYHQAWSRAYVCRKYGLTSMDARGLIRNALKWLGAAMFLNRARMERYAGSVLGTLDAWRGHSAFDRDGRE